MHLRRRCSGLLACQIGTMLLVLAGCVAPGLGFPRRLEVGGGPILTRALLPDGSTDDGLGGALHLVAAGASYWSLELGVSWAHHGLGEEATSGHQLGLIALTVRYLLDEGRWEPYLLGSGVLAHGNLPAEVPLNPLGLQLGVGVRGPGWPDWACGLEVRYTAFVADLASYPHYFSIGLRVDRWFGG